MRIRSSLLTKLLAGLVVRMIRLLFLTVRFECREEAPGSFGYFNHGPERFVYCVWHDSMIGPIFGHRCPNIAALVSRHVDGTYVEIALKLIGVSTVRGSTGRGGSSAVRQLMTVAKDKHISITPDGPRGPRRMVKSGIVFLASQTGRRIIPIAQCCRNSWRIQGSWTNLEIPKPFTTLFLLAGEPIQVPPNLSREDLSRYTALLQEAMDRLGVKARRLVTGEPDELPEFKVAA